MAQAPDQDLSRRERQIMHVLFRRGTASVTEIAADLPDAAIEIVPEAGHAAHLENPSAFLAEALDFLAADAE